MTPVQGALVAAILVGLLVGLVYAGRPFWGWVLALAGALAAWAVGGVASPPLFAAALGLWLAAAAVFGLPALRQRLVTWWVMRLVARMLPRMGETERIALEAGTVWWDRDLFSGAPDWSKLLRFEPRPLSGKERAFLDGPVQELCAMVDEWQVSQAGDLPPEAWQFIKRHGFFGMVIPEEYGGLGFSAIAHSAVVVKLASRSVTAAVTVMVPNSLGPAELLIRYGTDEQKTRYLPGWPPARRSRASRSPAPRQAAMRRPLRARASSVGASTRAGRSWACASTGASATSRSVRSLP